MENEIERYIGKEPKVVEYNDMYFAGTQAKVLFGNIWVDDIVTINWDLVEQKAPLYGYASETYDGVARGTQIVQGVFTIAFKQNEYISTIIDALNSRGAALTDILAVVKNSKARRALDARADSRASVPAAASKVVNYEQLLDRVHNDGTGAFKDFSAFLEDNIWGILGNEHKNAEQATDKDKLNGSIRDGFDILVTYGNIGNHVSEWTVKGVGDIHITGIRQILNPTGEPILEAYTFFGKLLDPYKEKRKRKAGIGTNFAAENSVDPFGMQWFGSQEMIEAEQNAISNLESVGPQLDTDGNRINDDVFPSCDVGCEELRVEQPNGIIPTTRIRLPVGGTTFYIVGGVYPTIDAEVELVGVSPGAALKTTFHWTLNYGGAASLNVSTRGPKVTLNLNDLRIQLLGQNLDNIGNIVLSAVAVYNGIDIQSPGVLFTVKLQ